MNENVTINELISRFIDEMQRLGYSEETIWREYHPNLCQIRKFYRKTGRTFYSLDTTAEYIQLQMGRIEAGEISNRSLHSLAVTAKRLDEFYLTGTLRVFQTRNKTRYHLTPDNERLLDLFLADRKYGNNTEDDVIWIVRRYLDHWEKLGYESLEEVSADDVRKFILKTASEVKVSSLHNILLYLKQFHIFLKESGIPAPDCVKLFSYTVYRDMPIQGYVTDEELESILNVIDNTTESGKRNRAIILLGATTGLRACDIIRLKLTDIDWRKGEISMVQKKTGKTVYAPLIREAGEAIQDYILNARPSIAECPEVFLRLLSPKTAIMDAMCITCMFKSYQEKAGIQRQPFDGKGFHGLRRRLAKKLLVAGVPLVTITQILGHEDIESARQYLSLDTGNLRECALDFSGIPLERRALS